MERLTLRLLPLSPIHVGTGEDLDWLSAVLDPQQRRLWRFDASQVRLAPDAQTKLEELAANCVNKPLEDVARPIGAIQQFLKGRLRELVAASVSESAVTKKLADRLSKLTGANRGPDQPRDTVNQISVQKCVSDARSGLAMIPGSSVKGALRTAWIDDMVSKQPPGQVAEEDLVPGFADDPFSCLQLEDFMPSSRPLSAILVAKNVKRNPRPDQRNAVLPVKVQALFPSRQSELAGGLRLSPRRSRHAPLQGKVPSILESLALCDRFHRSLWNEQRPMFERHAPAWWTEAMDLLLSSERDGSALIRVGKYCSAESKTHRRRKVQIGNPKVKPRPTGEHGTTMWIACDDGDEKGVPFGWALLQWGARLDAADRLLDLFESHEPWRDFAGAAPPPPGAPAPVFTPATQADQEIATLSTQKARGGLSEALLKSSIQNARAWPEAEKRTLREWIEANYRDVVKSFKQADFKQLLDRFQ